MSPVFVVIANVVGHKALEMTLVDHDHMIEQIAAAGTDEAFRHTVTLGALEAGALGLNAETLDCFSRLH